MDESLMGLAELPGGGHDASHLHAQGEVFSETIGDALRDGRPARRRLLLEPSIVTRSQVAVDLASQVRHGSSAASVMPRVLAPEARPACRSVPRLRGLIARGLAPAASGARPRDASRGPDGPGHPGLTRWSLESRARGRARERQSGTPRAPGPCRE